MGKYTFPLDKDMATHSSIPAWEIPRTEEHGGPQPMGSQGVGQNIMIKKQNLRHYEE